MFDKKIFTIISATIAASLCCLTPVLALLAGSSSLVSSFSWLQPYHNYLVGLTILVLVYAWWDKLKPKKNALECSCDEKSGFFSGKTFLAMVTVFSIGMLSFSQWGYSAFNIEPDCNTCTTEVVAKTPIKIEKTSSTCNSGKSCDSSDKFKAEIPNLPVLKYMNDEKVSPTKCNQQACTGTGNKMLDAMLANARKEVEEMSPAVLKKMLDNGEEVILLDVRGASNRKKEKIYTEDESYAISRCNLEFQVLGTIDNKDAVIVVYSRLGARSLLAAQSMKHLGYKNVYNLTAGVVGWARARYPFADGENSVIKTEKEI